MELSQRAILSASFTYLWKNRAQEDRSYLSGIPRDSHTVLQIESMLQAWKRQVTYIVGGRVPIPN